MICIHMYVQYTLCIDLVHSRCIFEYNMESTDLNRIIYIYIYSHPSWNKLTVIATAYYFNAVDLIMSCACPCDCYVPTSLTILWARCQCRHCGRQLGGKQGGKNRCHIRIPRGKYCWACRPHLPEAQPGSKRNFEGKHEEDEGSSKLAKQ